MPTQYEINQGQKRINFELTEVDKKLIEALRALMGIVRDHGTPPTPSQSARQTDFSLIEAALNEAATTSAGVADIDPPGCLGRYSDPDPDPDPDSIQP